MQVSQTKNKIIKIFSAKKENLMELSKRRKRKEDPILSKQSLMMMEEMLKKSS